MTFKDIDDILLDEQKDEDEKEDKRERKYRDAIKSFTIPQGNNNNNNNNNDNKKKIVPTNKYSKLGKGDLYESVILGGIPTFLRYDEENEKLVPYQQIEEETRILKPPSTEEYSYIPYEFTGLEELDEYLKYAKNQKID